MDRSVKFTLEKSTILSQLMVNDGTVTPTPYRLMGADEEDAGAIPMCCHLVWYYVLICEQPGEQ